ncbi:MAG: type III-A CRISPR-associated RAMP protein Csm3 [candidate division WOR-3 bacterium]|nr:type III-A CRISPR-associated RAMP protein Csm3 [candidate division WOR-3 bacterium]
MNEYKFRGKCIIKFNLKTLTGLHIGGTAEGIEIGGLDNPVIKDPITNHPYIPGSSLKGKLRSLLEWGLDKVFKNKKNETPPHTCENDPEIMELQKKIREIQEDKKEKLEEERKKKLKEKIENCPICRIFGISAGAEVGEPTRLTVRDSFPSQETIKKWENTLGKGIYTEMKVENTIDRITSIANPRTMERVPKDSIFEIEMIYDIYKDDDVDFLKYLFQAMNLLEDNFLGGSGSRGSGKIKFENPKISFRGKEKYYKTPNSEEKIIQLDEILKEAKNNSEISIPKRLYDRFEEIKKQLEEIIKEEEKVQ